MTLGDCRFHPGKHLFKDCPVRCPLSNERRPSGSRVMTTPTAADREHAEEFMARWGHRIDDACLFLKATSLCEYIAHALAEQRERDAVLAETHEASDVAAAIRAGEAAKQPNAQAERETAAGIWDAVWDLVAAGTPAEGIGVIARGNAAALRAGA